MNRPGGFAITERGLSLCAFPASAKILDIGCGTGDTVRHLRDRHGLEAQGVDKDPAAVADRAHLTCASGESLPFAEGCFDGVLLECSLSVMDDPDHVLKECHRVLAPGGWLLVSDVYARGEPVLLAGCLGRVETLAMLTARLQAHGFRLEHIEDFTSHLRALWGQRILEQGTAGLCAELGADRGRLKAIACGYALLVARKEGA
jgi:arsenite methyltransferase